MAFKNLKRFNAAITKAAKEVPEQKLIAFHTVVHLELLRQFIDGNPVLTGRSQNAWQSSIGAPTSEDIGGDPIPDKDTAKELALERAAKVLAGLGPYDSSHIYNNVDYVKYLEGGSSPQAPDGWIDLALARVADKFERRAA